MRQMSRRKVLHCLSRFERKCLICNTRTKSACYHFQPAIRAFQGGEPMKTTARRLRAPAAGSALTMAVCAALGTGPAEAIPEITPVNQQLGQFNVDFNHDGTPEFTLSFLPTFGENDVDTFLNEVVGFPVTSGPKPGPYGSALPPGTLIDGSLNYISGQSVILKGFNTITGGYG